MAFWENVKRDVQKGFKEGLAVIKVKAGQLTTEGKRQLSLFDLKNKVHKEMADLGGEVYGLSAKVENPLKEDKIKKRLDRIRKLEDQITSLEKKTAKKATTKKKVIKKKTAAKKTVARKKAVKK